MSYVEERTRKVRDFCVTACWLRSTVSLISLVYGEGGQSQDLEGVLRWALKERQAVARGHRAPANFLSLPFGPILNLCQGHGTSRAKNGSEGFPGIGDFPISNNNN